MNKDWLFWLTQKRPPLEKASLELASLELASLELASLELASHHLPFGKGLPSLRTLYLVFEYLFSKK